MRTRAYFSIVKNLAYQSIVLMSLLLLAACQKTRDAIHLPYVAPFKNMTSDSFTLVFLSSIEGYVEPCGCTSDPLGGLARFATVYSDIKSTVNHRLALIDAGNLLFDTPARNDADLCQDDKRIELLLSTLHTLGLTTTVSGPLDNARGESYRNQRYKKHGLQPLNPVDKINNNASNFFKIIQASNFNIALVAMAHSKKSVADTRKDLDALLKIATTSPNVKVVIALSQMPLDITQLVFDGIEDVDLVIQGQSQRHKPKAPTALATPGPFLVEGGRQGQYFTALTFKNLSRRKKERLSFDNRDFEKTESVQLLTTRIAALHKQTKAAQNERLEFLKQRMVLAEQELSQLQRAVVIPELSEPHFTFHAIPLTRKIESKTDVHQRLAQYEASIPLLVKKCEETIQCPKVEPHAPVYIGAQACKNCHQEAYDVWQKAVIFTKALDHEGKEITRSLGHSKAWKTLQASNKDADRSCIGCHSIGFMKNGGYCKAFAVDFRKDVQCESCHGAGSLHAQSGDKNLIKRQVPEETCRACHRVPHIESFESFNYEDKLVHVLGKGHGEALLKEITHRLKK